VRWRGGLKCRVQKGPADLASGANKPTLFCYAFTSRFVKEVDEYFGRKQAELEGVDHATSGIARLQRCSAVELVHDVQ
jgi:hypothetical protein